MVPLKVVMVEMTLMRDAVTILGDCCQYGPTHPSAAHLSASFQVARPALLQHALGGKVSNQLSKISLNYLELSLNCF